MEINDKRKGRNKWNYIFRKVCLGIPSTCPLKFSNLEKGEIPTTSAQRLLPYHLPLHGVTWLEEAAIIM